jgi:general secretion pathway protein D
MELQLESVTSWGIGYLNFQKDTNGLGRQGFIGTDLTTFLNPVGGKGAVMAFGNQDPVKITIPGSGEQTVTSLTGFINLLKTNAKTNILSTPQLVALDNEKATIEVGDKVPTSKTASTGASGVTTQNVTFEDATIKLEITPYISPSSETVRLKIYQEIKKPKAAPDALKNDAISLAKKLVDTNVVINNGNTVILGGLMEDQEFESVTKVPLLGDIPILGWLFKSKTTETKKMNLLVFLTPTIVRSAKDAADILSKKIDDRIEYIKAADGRDPHGKRLFEIAKKAQQAQGEPKNDEDVKTPEPTLDEPAADKIQEN